MAHERPRRRITLPALGRAPDAEMDAEIDAHVQLRIEALVQGGMAPDLARAAAEQRFGGNFAEARTRLRHAARRREAALRRRDWIGSLAGDLRYAVRQVRRSGFHSALTIVTLALGIGLTTAVFTLVEQVIITPLRLTQPEQLVAISGTDSLKQPTPYVSNDDWLDWRAGCRSFASMALYSSPFRTPVLTGDSAVRLNVSTVSEDFFATVGMRFVAGRPFSPDEVRQHARVRVVSERLWRQYLGADPSLSRTLSDGGSQIVGVVADGSEFPAGVDAWIPQAVVSYGGGATRNNINSLAVGRLQPGVTLARATVDLNGVSRQIRTRDAAGLYDFGSQLAPLQASLVRGTAPSLLLLAGGVGVVLLIVCANLAIATLGRGGARSGEFAIRASLGASRSRLVLQLLVEQLVLAGGGCVGGILVAWIAVRLIVGVWGEWIPRAGEVHLNPLMLGVAVALSLLVGLGAGIVPAVRGSRVSLHELIKRGSRQSVAGGRRGGTALVMAEFALAVALLAAAGLLLRSFRQMTSRDLGFSHNFALADITLAGPQYATDTALRVTTWQRLLDSYNALPGVRDAAVANWAPLATAGRTFLEIEGRTEPNDGAGYRAVSDDYFAAIGSRLLRGRTFGPQDNGGGTSVAVISDAAAKTYWPSQDPIGKRIRAVSMEGTPSHAAPWRIVVGVVGDIRQYGYTSDPRPEVYAPFRQAPAWTTQSMTALVAGDGAATRFMAPMRAATRQVDSHLAIEPTTMTERLSSIVGAERLTMSLLSGFALIAVALAAMGIYAVLSWSVAQRSREIAMRAALGAQRSEVLRLFVVEGLTTAGAGMAAGVLAALALSRVMASMLVDVTPVDPIAFGGAVALLLLVAVGATLVPAISATRLDPMLVLKGD